MGGTSPTPGAGPYHFSLGTSGGFPPIGLILSPDGVLSGTPTVVGTATFVVCAVDLGGNSKCATVTITVKAPDPAVPPELSRESCASGGSLRSISDMTTARLEFVNGSNQVRGIFWVNYDGARILYSTLAPGQSVTFATYLTHPWVVTDAAGTCLGIYLPTTTPSRVTLSNENDPIPSGTTTFVNATGITCVGPGNGQLQGTCTGQITIRVGQTMPVGTLVSVMVQAQMVMFGTLTTTASPPGQMTFTVTGFVQMFNGDDQIVCPATTATQARVNRDSREGLVLGVLTGFTMPVTCRRG